jgi:adenylate cyclase
MFERWYRRLAERYPGVAVAAALRLQHPVFVATVAVLALFVPLSLTEFLELSLAAMAGQSLYNFFTLRHFRRQLRPLVEWIAGQRSAESTRRAWAEAASVPYRLLRLWVFGGYPAVAIVGWTLFAAWRLELPAWGIPVLLAAAVVGTAYSNIFAFFLLERAFRPVVDDVGEHLDDEVEAEAMSLPLRRRLLAAVPALNVISGVVVVGAAAPDGGMERLALALLFSLAVALTFSFALSYLLAGSVTAPIDRLRAGTETVASGDLNERVPVAAGDEMGELTSAFNSMVGGLQERERLRDAFGTFVDPDLAERVARDGINLEGDEVDLSVLFMDVRGFTAFSEQAAATEVVARLNALYEVVVPVILRHGGHANKFIGDGLLAIFGAPGRLPDHADRALAASVDIIDCVEEQFAGDLRVGVGVNSGSAVVGTVGGGGRLDFTVIGDTVNTAARVESATRDTGDDILITEATRSRLRGAQHRLAERPPMSLKGKGEAVRVFAAATSERTAQGDWSSPMTTSELERVRERYDTPS